MKGLQSSEILFVSDLYYWGSDFTILIELIPCLNERHRKSYGEVVDKKNQKILMGRYRFMGILYERAILISTRTMLADGE